MNRRGIFLDDIRIPREVTWVRLPTDVDWTIARNYIEFSGLIDDEGVPDVVSFDHDLGLSDYSGSVWTGPKEKNGNDCANFLVNYCRVNGLKLPPYTVHSMNPVGRDNIHATMISGLRNQG